MGMTDIDVEPVDDVDRDRDRDRDHDRDHRDVGGEVEVDVSVDRDVTTASGDRPDLDAPEYVLYGGKGGVGKTTMAAATALESARAGVRTLVVSTDPAHSLSDTFERDVPSHPERIREDIPLFGVEIDPEEAVEAGEALFGGAVDPGPTDADPGPGTDPMDGADPMGGFGGMLEGDSPAEALFGGAMPGADEAVAFQQLLDLLDDDRFDRVVVDTAPTGHTLRLLELPEVMDTMVGRMARVRDRVSGMMDGLKGMFGAEVGDDGFDFDDLDRLRERIERLRAVLRDPAMTDFRVVMVPEEMSVLESERLIDRVVGFGIPVETVVVNRVMEDFVDITGDDTGEAFVTPDLDDCAFCQSRWEVQQTALGAAQSVFQGHRIVRVPLFAAEVKGERMLGLVGRCLRA
jgi:arsenite-transporting ATPase